MGPTTPVLHAVWRKGHARGIYRERVAERKDVEGLGTTGRSLSAILRELRVIGKGRKGPQN